MSWNREQRSASEASRGGELALAPLAPERTVAGAEAEQALFRLDLRRSLEMHGRLAMGIALLGAVFAAAYFVGHWPIYKAEAMIYVRPTPSTAVGSGADTASPYPYDPATYDSYMEQQVSSMTRADVLEDAMGKLGGWQKSGESDQDAIERLRRSLEVTRVDNSYQVSIAAHARDPRRAADVANTVANAYIESTRREEKAGDAERAAMLRDESDRVKTELTDDRAEQAQLNAELGVAAIGATAPEHYDDDIAKIHDELVKARADHDDAEARLMALDGGSAGNGSGPAALDAAADEIIAADPGLTSLKMALDTRRATLVSQMANLTPSHPEYKQDAAELARIDADLANATGELRANAASRIEQKLRSELVRTAGVEAELNAELAQMTRAAVSATPKLQRAADLAGDITRLQNRYNTLDEQLQNQMIEDATPERAHITMTAVPPVHPAKRGVIRNTLALLVGFWLLGMMAAVAAHKLDSRIYVASDVEQVLGFAPIALIPDFGEVSGQVAEEHLLRLSAAFEHAGRQEQVKSCIFTGTGPGAGATTIATRVCALLEGIGRPAVLVDSSGAAAVPRGAEPGARPEARSEARAEAAAEPSQARRSTRSLAVLQQLTEEAKAPDRPLILTDSAPLAVSAETDYLARNVDCAIVVMESGVTSRTQLRATANLLEKLDVRAVGFVLNRIRLVNADRAFRRSVQAMESHLRTRSRSAQVQVTEAEMPVAPRAAATASLPPSEASLPAAPFAEPEPDLPWWIAEKPFAMAQPTAATPPSSAAAQSAHAVPESRLSGLRNLFVARTAEPPARIQDTTTRTSTTNPQSFPQPVRQSEPAAADTLARRGSEPATPVEPASAAEAVPSETAREPIAAIAVPPAPSGGSTLQVTTVPEFLPPRQTRPARFEEEPSRRDRRETWDEVAVLPSWRGQYRRKE